MRQSLTRLKSLAQPSYSCTDGGTLRWAHRPVKKAE